MSHLIDRYLQSAPVPLEVPPGLTESELGFLAELEGRAGVAESTRRKYLRAYRAFLEWSMARGMLDPHPATVPQVCGYLAHLASRGVSASTVGVHVAAIGYAHRGRVSPSDAPRVGRLVAEIRRELGTAPSSRRRPLELAELGAMLSLTSSAPNTKNSLIESRDAAMLSVGWFGGLRRSELVQLRVCDVERTGFAEVALHLRRSKGDQGGAGVVVGLPMWPDVMVCPVRLLTRWLHDAGELEGSSAPLFPAIDRWGNIGGGLRGSEVHRIVRQRAERAELGALEGLGAHSLRVGFATECHRAGVPMLHIQRHLRHASRATTEGYVRTEIALGRENPIRGLIAVLHPR